MPRLFRPDGQEILGALYVAMPDQSGIAALAMLGNLSFSFATVTDDATAEPSVRQFFSRILAIFELFPFPNTFAYPIWVCIEREAEDVNWQQTVRFKDFF